MDEKRRSFVMKAMGKNLKLSMENAGINQTQLAEKLGYASTSTISQFINGISGMEVLKLMEAAEICNVPLNTITAVRVRTPREIRMMSNLEIALRKSPEPPELIAIEQLLESAAKVSK